MGSYSYDDANHLHAATFVQSANDDYSADYDAAGDMTARAPSESLPQQKLSWDNEGRLTAWQNAPSSPTSTAQYLYDGEGNRVEQQTTSSGTTTTTVYVGDIEAVATTGGISTTTTYYYAAGQRIALAVNGTLSYLASDLLGSATVALNSSGTPTASQLYAPYGGTRYNNGTMPTDYSFTGQRADAATGLDYYGARYYDPTLGQFSSADTMLQEGGFSACALNRYGYVKGNPETLIDPSGNCAQKAKPSGWAKIAKVALDAWAAAVQLFGIGHPVGEYSGSNRNGGGSPETQVESTYDPNKNVASSDSPPCSDDPPDGFRTAYVGPGGVVTGLEAQPNRATRRGQQPAQSYGPPGTNGIQGAQVEGKNAGDAQQLLDGSYRRQMDVASQRMDYIDRQLDAWLADRGYTPPQPATPTPPQGAPGWVPWVIGGAIVVVAAAIIVIAVVTAPVWVPVAIGVAAGVLVVGAAVAVVASQTDPHSRVS